MTAPNEENESHDADVADVGFQEEIEDESNETRTITQGDGNGSVLQSNDSSNGPESRAFEPSPPKLSPTFRSDTGTPSPSALGSPSIPDDTPSIRDSAASSRPSSAVFSQTSLPIPLHSPSPSFRPFDRRFQARASSSLLASPRGIPPAFLSIHSRHASLSSQIPRIEDDEQPPPWEVIRWTRLRRITGQLFSELGRRNFGRPTFHAVSSMVAIGTSKGLVLIFDFQQSLRAVIGQGTRVESGAVSSLAISADHTTIAVGHRDGSINTWEIARPSHPFLQIPPVDRRHPPLSRFDGHTSGTAVVHIGFLGTRHTALVSADERGMAFSHLATRGMGAVARIVRTTRILGRYPDSFSMPDRPRKPSSVLAFAPLPLGNVEQTTDGMGLVAMLTPYLLVIVSTTPIAQTQHKTARPKELASSHGTMSAALAWFPAVKLKFKDSNDMEATSKTKLAYSWSNILSILEVSEVEPLDASDEDKLPVLQFKVHYRWKSEEPIVAIQWLSRTVLGILTLTQRLIIIEESSMRITETFDLLPKHIFHADLFSNQLSQLVEQLDEDDTSMHGVVADAFYMSFRAYKGRIFLLGFDDMSIGTLSNWADRLLALMEAGDYTSAIELATTYYNGAGEKQTVGLPEDDEPRHTIVRDKLKEMMSASLKYAFTTEQENESPQDAEVRLKSLARVCLTACISINDTNFLFDDVYSWYEDNQYQDVFISVLEPLILNGDIKFLPPGMIKDLVSYYIARSSEGILEELICHLDTSTMDLDQVTALCKKNHLYDAFIYVWNQAIGDYTTPLEYLISLSMNWKSADMKSGLQDNDINVVNASKMFPYLSYILTGRIYPTGEQMNDQQAKKAKAALYYFLFSGRPSTISGHVVKQQSQTSEVFQESFSQLKKILDFDAPSLLSVLNEAFEDGYLNGTSNSTSEDMEETASVGNVGEVSMNRQYIIQVLLEVMHSGSYAPEDTIYLDMFISRNLPKFPQFVLLPGRTLHDVLVRLCRYPNEDVAEDCQLSVEYLFSSYHPPDLQDLISLFNEARFYRVLKSIYRSEGKYTQLMQTYFTDSENEGEVFECIAECLGPQTKLSKKQRSELRSLLKAHALQLLTTDVARTAESIEAFIPDLHEDFLRILDEQPHSQFTYLQAILEPRHPEVGLIKRQASDFDQGFIEQYVRLMCDCSPSHVTEYVELLNSSDLRLEEVLPAMEKSGVVDAAVVLLARQGQIQDGMTRLVKHLSALESALIGILESMTKSPDVASTCEAVEDLISSLQKYVKVGIWLCQGQSKSIAWNAALHNSSMRSPRKADEELSAEETLWLDLIEVTVHIAKDATATFNREQTEAGLINGTLKEDLPTSLRTMVQQVFTALLKSTTSNQRAAPSRPDFTFLRILRTFLTRASESSPSLSELRTVLAAIFSAYAYEESLLSLANKMLDKDLFVQVDEAAKLRRRGWRPLGQICEGCGKRAWGPGIGSGIWNAWQKRTLANGERRYAKWQERSAIDGEHPDRGKGKAAADFSQPGYLSQGRIESNVDGSTENLREGDDENPGALVVFSCRHLYHRRCLLKTRGDAGTMTGVRWGKDLEFTCPSCI